MSATSPRELRVLALTGGVSVPSARFRVEQYVGALAAHGVRLTPAPAPLGSYPPPQRSRRAAWLAATLASRLPSIVRSHAHDVTLLQREMVSTFATLERFTARPRVLDVDDALWCLRGGAFARTLARQCDEVICGNAFLADWFGRWNRRIRVIPTAVDTSRYHPAASPASAPAIGWTGAASAFPHLHAIEDAIATVLASRPDAVLRVMADAPPRFARLPASRVEFVPWSREREVPFLQSLTVGVMPLPDSDWTRGKCSYKMLLYMACGVPAVVSRVGMNREVLALAPAGALGADSRDEWIEALGALLDAPDDARRMGASGRVAVEREFSVPKVAGRLAEALRAWAPGAHPTAASLPARRGA